MIRFRQILLLSMVLWLSLGFAGCADGGEDAPQEGGTPPEEVEFLTYEDDGSELALEAPAPDFTLTTLEGETVSLSDYEGKIVLLSFFAST